MHSTEDKVLKRVYATIALSLLTLAAAPSVKADDTINTDRPDFTESTATVPVGMHQLELGYTYTSVGDDHQQTYGEYLYRVPAGKTAEARFYVNSYETDRGPSGNVSGVQDSAIGLKYKLSEPEKKHGILTPDVSVILLTSLPTGGKDLRENNWQPQGKLCAGWDLTERWDVTTNINFAYASSGGKRFNQWAASASFGYSIDKRWGSFFEYYGFYPGDIAAPNAHYVDSGLTYQTTKDRQFDIRAGKGANGIGQDYFLGTGYSIRW